MRRLLFFILILSTTQVLATRVVGNGGDAIVCRKNGKIFSAELLDFFEARVLRNIQLFTPTPNQDYKTIISDRLAIMEKVSPNNAKLIREELDVITGDGHLFLDNIDLFDVPDSHHIVLPKGCEVEQAAIRQTPKHPGDKKYIFNLEIWKALNELNRAGLVMHEVLYDMSQIQEDSTRVRYVNSQVFSNNLPQLTAVDFSYFAYVQKVLRFVELEGHILNYEPQAYDYIWGGGDNFRGKYQTYGYPFSAPVPFFRSNNWVTTGNIYFNWERREIAGFFSFSAFEHLGKKYYAKMVILYRGKVVVADIIDEAKKRICRYELSDTGLEKLPLDDPWDKKDPACHNFYNEDEFKKIKPHLLLKSELP